jgi:hypothetical protein
MGAILKDRRKALTKMQKKNQPNRNQVPVEPSEEEIAIYAYMNWEAEGRPEVPGYKPLGTGRGAIVSPLCSRSIGAIHARATQQTLVTSTSAPETAIHSQA